MKYDNWQQEFLNTKGDKILCSGRQVGKSVICGADAGEYAINNPKSQPILMIAPTERQAYALFDKTLSYLLENYPKYIITKGAKRPTKTKIELKSGVKIYCLPVGQTGLGVRFLTVGRLYAEEASRIPEDVWTAVIPALLTTGGDSIYLSTPFGKQGEFYDCWINKDDAYKSFKRFSITSEIVMKDRPICTTWTEKTRERALIKLEQAKARMTKKQYAQEYLGEFVDDLFNLFKDNLIRQTCVLKRRNLILKDRKYFLGVDIARMGEDEGTYEIIDKINDNHLEQIENLVTRKKLTTETYDRIINLERQYNFARKGIGIDAGAGSLGVTILDFLLRVPIIRKKVIALNNRKVMLDRDGNSTQRLLKEDMYFYLLALMEQGKIKLLDDDDIIESLRSVQYEYIMKEGQPTKVKIFGNYTHIAEGLIRACWLANQKSLNVSISYI